MKNLLPLLALALAVPAAAADSAPAAKTHCADREWLMAAPVRTDGQLPAAPDPSYYATVKWENTDRTVLNSDGKSDKLCDAAVWRYIRARLDKDFEFKRKWVFSVSDDAKMTLEVDDMLTAVDAKGAAALAAADAVVDAAVKAGVAKKTDGADLSALKTAGLTADAYASAKGVTVEKITPDGSVKPEDAAPHFKKLLDSRKGADKKVNVIPGPAIVAFRQAVIDLANAVVPGKKFAKQTDYAEALKAAAGAAALEPADAAEHDDAALSRVDYGLRNLISNRAAAVAAAYEAAKGRVGPAAPAEADKSKKTGAPAAPGDLPAEVMDKLSKAKDYSDLNALFDAKTKAAATDPKAAEWLKSDDGKAVAQRLESLRADAKATTVGKNGVDYTVGGVKLNAGVSVPDLKNARYRGYVADAIVQNILDKPADAKVAAVLAAFRNQSPEQQLSPAEKEAAKKVPPPADKKEEKTPLKTAWDTIAATTPEPHWWNSAQGRLDAYRSAEVEKHTEEAALSSKVRTDSQREAQSAKDAKQRACDEQVAAIKRMRPDPTMDPSVWLAGKLKEVKNCEPGDVQKAYDDKVAEFKQKQEEADKAAGVDRQTNADKLIRQAYAEEIAKSVAQLRAEYNDPKSDRAKAAASASAYGDFYGAHLETVDGYFKRDWEGDNLKPAAEKAAATSVDKCRDTLWHAATRLSNRRMNPASFKDPSVENVDDGCVRDPLVKSLREKLYVAPPPATAKK